MSQHRPWPSKGTAHHWRCATMFLLLGCHQAVIGWTSTAMHGFDCWKTAASSKGGKGSLHLLGLFNPSKTCANQHKRASLSRKEKKRRKKKKKERKTEIKLLSPHSRANHPVSLTLGAPEDYLAPHLSSCLSDSGFLFSPPSLSLWASPGISLPLMQCLPTTRSPLQQEASPAVIKADSKQGPRLIFCRSAHTSQISTCFLLLAIINSPGSPKQN